MEFIQPKSNMKRARGADDVQQRENQRPKLQDESMDETTKITDINDDCLVKIFGHLNLRSLFNVAVASEWLRPAAASVYTRKFSTKNLVIGWCDDIRPKTRSGRNPLPYSKISEYELDIGVRGLKTALRYLRCFGSSITYLSINYGRSKSKRFGFVHQYVNKYCSESLTHLSFSDMPSIEIDQFEKIFVNVHEVTLWCGYLGKQLATFIRCFPNLRRLDLYGVNLVYRTVEKPFQCLKDLSLIDCHLLKSETKAADLLRVNDQLENLKIKFGEDPAISMDQLQNMITNSPSLVKLSVAIGFHYNIHPSQVKLEDVQRLTDQHPLLVELDLFPYRLAGNDVIALIPQLSPRLKQFSFMMLEPEFSQIEPRPYFPYFSEWSAEFFDDFLPQNLGEIAKVTLKR